MNADALERIRQALQLGANQKEIDAALAALADLERRASCPLGTMASGGSARDRPFTIFTSFDLPPGTPVYSATPIPAGMFTAEQMRAVKFETNELWDALTSALQWLRNIRDGISTPETAIENTEAMIAHCREVEERTK